MRYITYKMSTDDYTLKIIQECEALGGKLTCHGSTDALLTAQSSLKGITRMILKADWEACITKANPHDSTVVASCTVFNISWLKLWDMALDNGSHGTNALYPTLTKPKFQSRTCCVCGTELEIYHYTLCHYTLCQPRAHYQLSLVCKYIITPNIIILLYAMNRVCTQCTIAFSNHRMHNSVCLCIYVLGMMVIERKEQRKKIKTNSNR